MAATVQLSERLKQETAPLHRQAERSGVMRDLLARQIDRGAYIALIRNLHEVYSVLEQNLVRWAADPGVLPISLGGLPRAAAIARDLEALHGPDWAAEVRLVPAGSAYAARICEAAAEFPHLLAAHAYVRYLGDLSGGQALRGLIKQTLVLVGDAGTDFYRFPGSGDLEVLKGQFRAGLDSIQLDEPGIERLAREARLAFQLNIDLFEDLSATSPQTPASAE